MMLKINDSRQRLFKKQEPSGLFVTNRATEIERAQDQNEGITNFLNQPDESDWFAKIRRCL